MQFATRLMPRPSDSHDHPTPLPTSLSLSFARPPRSVLTNQSRVQDGLFYGCGDGLMDFEVPDAISARAGGREGERARGEATPERNFQGSRQPSQGKATRKATVSFRGRCRTVGAWRSCLLQPPTCKTCFPFPSFLPPREGGDQVLPVASSHTSATQIHIVWAGERKHAFMGTGDDGGQTDENAA